jgi:two-component system OmpR family response regulator
MVADLVSKALSSQDVSVVTVPGAQTAIAAADKQLPDVVVMELVLPAHNGIEFLYEFRSYPEWASIPVVLFSSQRIDESLVARLPHVSYIYKPLSSLADVSRHLESLLA